MTHSYADILLPMPLADKYTYSIPRHMQMQCYVGSRVLIQFGKKRIYTGVVFQTHNNKPEHFEVKQILDILDSEPIINQFQLRMWSWSANYYMCPMGDFFKAALPSGLRIESETKILPTLNYEHIHHLSENGRMVYYALENNISLTANDIAKITMPANPVTVIKELLDNNAAIVQEQVKTGYKPKTEKRLRIHSSVTTEIQLNLILDSLKNAVKQQQLLTLFISTLQNNIFDTNGINKHDFLKQHSLTNAAVKGLIEKSVLEEFTGDISRLNINNKFTTIPAHQLNEHQQNAYNSIIEQFKHKDTVLLHGVTSSGKTELYIHLIERTINEGRQVLYLLPEIALTSQIIHRLQKVFGNKIGVYHSKFSDAERVEIYRNLLQNNENTYKIILGVRSSVFLPFSNLGLVIVDEEHENTYKQFDPSPRYNARDMAIVLALMHKGNTLLGSATPSIESYYNAQTGRYGLAELHHRFKNIQLPQIEIADTLRARKKKQMVSHFSPQLIKQIDTALANNEQVILFQNRRGFSPFIECNSCGWIPKCKACDVSLTYHKAINKLVCHYCGFSINNIIHCPQCKQADIETKGFGTEKIEDEISLIFRNARVGRLDLDTAKGKHGHEKIISDFQNHELDILIGTQMVSKGLDFDHVKVVGILNADSMLGYPDFRAFERSYQLMAQVAGRAGRRDKQGTVVIQTYYPEHKIIMQVKHNRFDLMYSQQLNERKQFFYPPYSRLIKIIMKHRHSNTLNSAAILFANNIKEIEGIKVLGPTNPVIMKVQNLYIKHTLVKLSRTQDLTDIKNTIRKKAELLNQNDNYKSVQIIFDVDPM